MKKIILLCALLLAQSSFAKNEIVNNMNDIYKELIKDNIQHKDYIQKVKDAQKKWNEFLKAQVDIMYPPDRLGTAQYNAVENYRDHLDLAITNETKYLFYTQKGSDANIFCD